MPGYDHGRFLVGWSDRCLDALLIGPSNTLLAFQVWLQRRTTIKAQRPAQVLGFDLSY
jgi:hypothetical protein